MNTMNPDTDLPMPSPSAAQRELVEDLMFRVFLPGDADELRAVLTEAVVRQHGRTLRGCIAELDSQAAAQEAEARRRVAHLRDGEATATELLPAAEHAAAARTLRRVFLRGDRS